MFTSTSEWLSIRVVLYERNYTRTLFGIYERNESLYKMKKKSHQKAEICGENFSIYCSLIHCFECFLIFHFKHVLREVGRKVLMEPVLTMDRGFQAQLYLWSPPLPINVTRSWCTNLARAGTQITISITGKVLLTFTVLEWLVVMHMIFDRNTGGKISKNKWLFEPNLRYYSYFKRFTGLGIYALHPWTPIAWATQLHKMYGCFTPRCSF